MILMMVKERNEKSDRNTSPDDMEYLKQKTRVEALIGKATRGMEEDNNSNNTQTAVNWLQDKIKETYDKEGKLPLAYILDLVRQAKEMEKEQVMLAFNDGKVNSVLNKRGSEEYYQDTYGKGIL
jgi:hypothetical protein